ncbi:protein tramtrack, beta isoform-like [Anopheles cruzii]|uniref:protein tramtrack, beta isoform-like n=1 Tax=Anopheles cruzii TaxID=68878 RepID=UPI0022EC46C1|nr:protein tramtrack, beta isoform-like [Anopheles cruzii]
MSAGLSQQFCVRWNSHLGSLGAAFPQLLAGQRFVDVTLACEGHQVHCHRLVLAACSTYFEHLLGENPCQHPIIILPRDIKLWAMQALVDFMYKGEVNVSQAGLPDLMKCAEILKIRGLCGSDAALNLNQIHSPPVGSTASFQQQQQQQQQQHLPATDAGTDATTMTSTKDTRTSNNKQSHSQFQNRSEPHHNTRASQQSSGGGAGHRGGPKGQLLSSLHLQPVIGARSQLLQDDCNISDNGESSNEMCIKTEDLIDDDTSSKPCEDEEELEMDPGEKIPSDANRCEQQLLEAHAAAMEVEELVDDGVSVQEAESGDKERSAQNADGSATTSSDAQDAAEPEHTNDDGNGQGDEVLEMREETDEPLAVDVAAKSNKAEQERPRTRPLFSSARNGAPNNDDDQRQQKSQANGAKSGAPLTIQRAPPGSIRVKSIENLFANYQSKHSSLVAPGKSSRAEKRRLGLQKCPRSESANSDRTGRALPASLVFNRDAMDIYLRSGGGGGGAGDAEDEATSATDEDGYENIICSPNFPPLSGVISSYKAEEEEEEEEEEGEDVDYSDDRYAIQLLAEEIDSRMLANGADSEGDEILLKPPALMSLGKGSGTVGSGGGRNSMASVRPQILRTYGRGVTGSGAGSNASLTVRKLARQTDGGGSHPANSRQVRRPRLTARAREAFSHLMNPSGAPPPISFTLRNPRGNQPRSYNTEALWAALMDVKAGESIYRASQMHKVPRKTLRNWMKRWDIKSAYPMPRQLKEAAEKKRIIKELTSQIQ